MFEPDIKLYIGYRMKKVQFSIESLKEIHILELRLFVNAMAFVQRCKHLGADTFDGITGKKNIYINYWK